MSPEPPSPRLEKCRCGAIETPWQSPGQPTMIYCGKPRCRCEIHGRTPEEAREMWNLAMSRPSIAPTASQGTEGKPDKGMVELVRTLLDNDGGEGSKCYHAIRYGEARDALRAALRSERAEGEAERE